MARKGENIHKRKDGRWEGRYKNGFKESGEPHYVSVYGKTYSEAKQKLIKAKANAAFQITQKPKEYRFSEILEMWLNTNRVWNKGSTEAKYHFMIEKHIMPTLGNQKLSAITATNVNAFLEEKLKTGRLNGKGGLSPAYVKTLSIIIDSALHYAVCEGYCLPLKTPIFKPSVGKKNLQILTIETQKKVESLAKIKMDETKFGIFLCLHTGLRIGEICALAWEDIDIETRLIHVRHTISRVKAKDGSCKTRLIIDTPKTESSIRDIPISSALYPTICMMKQHSDSAYVVSTKTTFISTRTFDYRYRETMKSMGMEVINFHALRHTFATRCIERGVDVKTLSELLGHANATITLNTYVHPSMELKRIQVEKICTL